MKIRCSDISTQRVDGHGLQRAAYMSALLQLHQKFDWLAFLDIDEFVCLSGHESIKDILAQHNDDQAVALQWRLFGGNDNEAPSPRVLDRCLMRQRGWNKHVKTILNAKLLTQTGAVGSIVCPNPHCWFPVDAVTLTGHHIGSSPFVPEQITRHNPEDMPYLAHFFCKSRSEWKLKQAYGKADHPEGSPDRFRKDEEYDAHNFCEVFDDRLKRVLYKEKSWTV